MRSLISILAILIASTTFANTDTHRLICRETYFMADSDLSVAVAVEKDLLSGLWSVDGAERYSLNTRQTVFEFNEAGVLDVFMTDLENRTLYESKFWYVEQYGEIAFLVIENATNSRDHLFEVEQTCEGAILRDVSGGETIYLTFLQSAGTDKYQLRKNMLTGTWSNVEYPFELTNSLDGCGTFEAMDGARFKYVFNEDGTFLRVIGNKVMQLVEEGVWSLSGNGQFVTLYFNEDGDPENVYAESVLEIEDLNGSHMRILQSIETTEFASFFCTPVKSFAFGKKLST